MIVLPLICIVCPALKQEKTGSIPAFSYLLQPQQLLLPESVEEYTLFGGKKSSTGNDTLSNSSQGSSVLQEPSSVHSPDGMQ